MIALYSTKTLHRYSVLHLSCRAQSNGATFVLFTGTYHSYVFLMFNQSCLINQCFYSLFIHAGSMHGTMYCIHYISLNILYKANSSLYFLTNWMQMLSWTWHWNVHVYKGGLSFTRGAGLALGQLWAPWLFEHSNRTTDPRKCGIIKPYVIDTFDMIWWINWSINWSVINWWRIWPDNSTSTTQNLKTRPDKTTPLN